MESGEAARGSLREIVYALMRTAVLDGQLQPGAPLSEIALAQRFNTSRSPVREALGRLEQEGYVLRKPNGRAIVAPLDTEELWNLYQVRAALEGLAARLATPHLTGLALDEMAGHLERMREHSVAGDIDASLAAGGRFHDVVSRHCANQPLREMVESVRERIKRYRRLIASLRDRDLRIGEHAAILKAFEKRDAGTAEAAMREHILRSAETLRAGLGTAPAFASVEQRPSGRRSGGRRNP